MPFHLAEIQQDDCTEFALLDEAATVNWPLAQAMEQGHTSHVDMFEEWFQRSFGKVPGGKWMKVVDDETGEMAAGAVWRFPVEGEPTDLNAGATGERGEEKPGGDAESVPAVFVDMGKRWKAFEEEFIGNQSYANLQVLVTHPKYQRKGAGSMLIKYGCDMADRKGILCAVGASNAGYLLYTRHGFELKQEYEVDLSRFGVDAVELARTMIRPARRFQA